MDKSMSRRRLVTAGAAGAVGAGLPLASGTVAEAAPPAALGRVFDVTRFGARGDGVTIDSGPFDNVDVRYQQHDTRPAHALRDVTDADFHHSRPVPDTRLDHADHKDL